MTSGVPANKLSFWHPANLVATGFGIGRLPWAPGTWGSLAALPLAWVMWWQSGPAGVGVAALAAFAAGWGASDVYIRASGAEDPPEIVIDEIAGQLLTLSVVPADVVLYAAGLVLFRLVDIFKPWPVSWAETRLKGGLGVMADDFLASLYAAMALFLIFFFFLEELGYVF
ncbi:MAG: phosphatidylglycerophosphatase A [Proteobacteria bacterium]|nr:phosphatidylglycerophosphatase A [Pseudomonadota bacterium]